MIDVNWDVAADGTATRLVTCEDSVYWAKDGHIWHNNGAYWVKRDPGCIFQTIATRPQQKTVADAVEQGQPHFKATRENLENIAKDFQYFEEVEQEGEKWTHITNSGYKCKIHLKEPDENYMIVVSCSDGVYRLHDLKTLKPIKPTISESEAIGILMANKHLSFAALLEDYDVVKD